MLLQMALLHSFLCLSNSALYTWTESSLPIPLSVDISVASVLAVVNSAAVNIGVHLSFQPRAAGFTAASPETSVTIHTRCSGTLSPGNRGEEEDYG